MKQSATTTGTQYTIDWFEPGDREAFLSLFETVFDSERSVEWFRWKYEANPYVDHMPITVAKSKGELVGARGLFPLELSVTTERQIAYQPCDTMVHHDHRRRGLFTRMNKRGLERYADGPPTFFFNFPNAQSKPGNVKLGWRPVGTVPMYYRLQNPIGAVQEWAKNRSLVSESADSSARPSELLKQKTETLGSYFHRTVDHLLTHSAPEIHIEQYETPPVSILEALSREPVTNQIHVTRNARFYRWRLANPRYEYITYVASRDGPIAALIVSPVDDHIHIVDVVPRERDSDSEGAVLEQLLLAVLSDHREKQYFTAFGDILPTPLQYRFLPDTRPPLSTLIQPTTRTLYVRALEDDVPVESSTIDDWTLSRLDLDTA